MSTLVSIIESKIYVVITVMRWLPTAKILEETDEVYTVSAEVFGKGIEMWFRSRGEYVEVMR